MQTIFITGATGFVGSRLVDRLSLSSKYNITAAVRRRRDTIPNGVSLSLHADLGLISKEKNILLGTDVVIHLAGRAHNLIDTAENPDGEFYRVNTEGSRSLAKLAAGSGVKRFVYISSIGVNGAYTKSRPFSELSEPSASNGYARSKLEAELEIKEICDRCGMEFVIIRPPLVYAGDAPGNFNRLLKLIHKRTPLPLRSVKNKRSMVAIENLVDFIEVCVNHPGAANEVFLIADGVDVSVPRLIDLLSEGMGRKSLLFPVPVKLLKSGASFLGKQSLCQQLCESLQVDISKAVGLLDWSPLVDAEESLRNSARQFYRFQMG
jgi:nucleoside-diphosphate-sugar epimerase